MPSLLDIFLDPVSLVILAMYASLMLWEAVFPARALPPVRFWKLRGLAAFFLFFCLSSYLPLFIDPYLSPFRILDLSHLSPLVGGILGVVLYDFGMYLWHFSLHRNNFLWRTFHQMHHSAERLDTYGAFYFSPFDMVGWILLSSLCFSVIAGFSPQTITVILLVTNFQAIFQHANIKTPQWIGYIIQRPESHTMHHARGIHKCNYSDLPLFDILFGTFHNPKDFEHETGFYHGASARIVDMLLARDVSEPVQKPKPVHGVETAPVTK
jgi:sterol desaturase/sphingolipid hydroxylase (fatty acid hydroxylase superfamily)